MSGHKCKSHDLYEHGTPDVALAHGLMQSNAPLCPSSDYFYRCSPSITCHPLFVHRLSQTLILSGLRSPWSGSPYPTVAFFKVKANTFTSRRWRRKINPGHPRLVPSSRTTSLPLSPRYSSVQQIARDLWPRHPNTHWAREYYTKCVPPSLPGARTQASEPLFS